MERCVCAGRPCEAVAVGSSQSNGSSAIAPGTFLRAGSVEAVKQRCSAGTLDRVVVNNMLSGVQQRNLEAAWGCACSLHNTCQVTICPWYYAGKLTRSSSTVRLCNLLGLVSNTSRCTNTQRNWKGTDKSICVC